MGVLDECAGDLRIVAGFSLAFPRVVLDFIDLSDCAVLTSDTRGDGLTMGDLVPTKSNETLGLW